MKVDPMIGAELAGYRIESLLGRGGMSVVYLAEQVRLGRKVALKILAPELAEDPDFRDRFEHESRLAASLDHAHVIPIYEAGEADGNLFIAMRYVAGTDLETLVRRLGALDLHVALDIAGQIAGALDAAHQLGLVHRDVKPSNILLAGDATKGYHAYLADFGLTKKTASVGDRTKTGQFIGSIDYASPEQIEGKPLDGRSDQYSLDCVLYFCLTGQRPFERDSEVAVLYAHLKDKPPRVSETSPDLPKSTERAVTRAMSKSPEERFPTCSDLVDFATTSEVVPEPLRRRRRPFLVLAALAAVVLMAATGALIWARGNGDQSGTESPAPAGIVQAGLVRLDPSSGEPAATAPLQRVTWVDSTADLVWALSAPRTLAKVRADTGGIIGEIELEPFALPEYYSFGSQGFDVVATTDAVWVVGRGVPGPEQATGPEDSIATLSRIDPATNRVRNRVIDDVENVSGLAFGAGALWSHDPDSAELLRFDARTLELTARVPVPGTSRGPSSLTYGEGFVWVADASGTLSKVDPATNEIAASIEVEGAWEVAAGEGGVWVTTDKGTIVAIEPGSDAIVDEVKFGPPPRSVTYTPVTNCCHPGAGLIVDDGSVWVVSTGDERLVEIDSLSHDVKSRIPIPGKPLDVTAAAGSLWVSVR